MGREDDFPMKTPIASITIDVKYNIKPGYPNGTHSSSVDFAPTDLYCPKCGQHQVWVDTGPGDYYSGPTHYCLACRRIFYVDTTDYVCPRDSTDPDSQIINAISAHINGRLK